MKNINQPIGRIRWGVCLTHKLDQYYVLKSNQLLMCEQCLINVPNKKDYYSIQEYLKCEDKINNILYDISAYQDQDQNFQLKKELNKSLELQEKVISLVNAHFNDLRLQQKQYYEIEFIQKQKTITQELIQLKQELDSNEFVSAIHLIRRLNKEEIKRDFHHFNQIEFDPSFLQSIKLSLPFLQTASQNQLITSRQQNQRQELKQKRKLKPSFEEEQLVKLANVEGKVEQERRQIDQLRQNQQELHFLQQQQENILQQQNHMLRDSEQYDDVDEQQYQYKNYYQQQQYFQQQQGQLPNQFYVQQKYNKPHQQIFYQAQRDPPEDDQEQFPQSFSQPPQYEQTHQSEFQADSFSKEAKGKYLVNFDPTNANLYILDLKFQGQEQKKVYVNEDQSYRVPQKSTILVSHFGNIYVIGGKDSLGNSLASISVVNLTPQSTYYLNKVGELLVPRHSHSAISVNQNIYIAGGYYQGQLSNAFETFSDTLEVQGGRQKQLNNCLSLASRPCLIQKDKRIIYKLVDSIISNQSRLQYCIELYKIGANIWERFDINLQELRDQAFQRNCSGLQVSQNQIMIFGGTDLNDIELAKTFKINFQGDTKATISEISNAKLPSALSFEYIQPVLISQQVFFRMNNTKQKYFFFDP